MVTSTQSPSRSIHILAERTCDDVARGAARSASPVPEPLVPGDPLESVGHKAGAEGIEADELLHRLVFQMAEQQYDVGEVAHR
jgi:hypothetical protein